MKLLGCGFIAFTLHVAPGRGRSSSSTVVALTAYGALPTSRGHTSPLISRKAAIARPLGLGMGVFLEFEVWPKFYLRSCAGWNIARYCTGIYRVFIVLRTEGAILYDRGLPVARRNQALTISVRTNLDGHSMFKTMRAYILDFVSIPYDIVLFKYPLYFIKRFGQYT